MFSLQDHQSKGRRRKRNDFKMTILSFLRGGFCLPVKVACLSSQKKVRERWFPDSVKLR
jgi:hypothetical protein